MQKHHAILLRQCYSKSKGMKIIAKSTVYDYINTYCLQLDFQDPRLFLSFAQVGLIQKKTEQRGKYYWYKEIKNDFLSLTCWFTLLTETEYLEHEAGVTINNPACVVHLLSLLHFAPVLVKMLLQDIAAVSSVFKTDFCQLSPQSRAADKWELSNSFSLRTVSCIEMHRKLVGRKVISRPT